MYIMHIMRQEGAISMNDIKKKCRYCGNDFSPNREWQKFCNPKHQKAYWKDIQNGKYKMNERLEKIEEHLGIKDKIK